MQLCVAYNKHLDDPVKHPITDIAWGTKSNSAVQRFLAGIWERGHPDLQRFFPRAHATSEVGRSKYSDQLFRPAIVAHNHRLTSVSVIPNLQMHRFRNLQPALELPFTAHNSTRNSRFVACAAYLHATPFRGSQLDA